MASEAAPHSAASIWITVGTRARRTAGNTATRFLAHRRFVSRCHAPYLILMRLATQFVGLAKYDPFEERHDVSSPAGLRRG